MNLQDYILEQVSLKRLTAIEAMQLLNELKNSNTSQSKEYAVIGIACRFSQANTVNQYWENLINKRDTIGPFPKHRIQDVKCINQQTFDMFRGLNCRVGSYLDRIDLFDHTFFGLTPAETRVMDPQQRIFLETAVEALEDAGLTEDELKESKTGVYVGFSINDDNYIDIVSKDDSNVALGNQPSVLAYRLSFLYDLRGPTMIVDTSCSSSLVAVHQACQAILTGDCEQAIVGGVNIRLFPAIREINNLGIEAYDGRCKSFDEKANGTNIGDGVAAMVIKRKDLAERDGDFIHAIIKGSAVNSDGSSNGITAPNPEAQASVIAQAWKKAGINPEKLNFIETHGTGTKLGDPIEITGLSQAFSEFTSKKQFCALGAVKTNIGHLEATSGMAGLIKAVLCLKHRQLPANIHYTKPNAFIDFGNAPVYVNTKLKTWAPSEGKLTAGTSSFGISGTNCHVVVEEYQHAVKEEVNDDPSLIFISAKNEESLKGILSKYSQYLKNCPYSLADICFSSAIARNHYSHRIAIIVNSIDDLKDRIDLYLSGREHLDNQLDSNIFYQNLTLNRSWSCQIRLTEELEYFLHLYFSGQNIDWKSILAHKSGRKVPLPTYSFLPKRHWPKIEIEMEDFEQRIDSVCHAVKWAEEENMTAVVEGYYGKYLYFMQDLAVHENFFNLSEQRGVQGTKVYMGSEFKRINAKTFCIDPKNSEHYEKLIEELSRHGQISGVVHMWDCLPIGKTMDSFEGINESQITGTMSSYHLIRAFQKQYIEPAIRFITMTAYAHQVTENDIVIDPSRMPSLGINKVISQEYPKTLSLAIDCDIDNYNDQTGDQLFSEIFDSIVYKDAVVAIRDGKRFVQIIDRLNLHEIKDRKVSIRDNGVYVIAGGTGYLGIQTSLLLARKARVKIALLSRRPASELTEKHQRQFDEIRKNGSEVMFIQTDTTDAKSCREAIKTVNTQYGSINGVFVANKNISHQRLDDVAYDFINSNILSKLKAVWLLDNLTADQKPDFMATFSSISSLTGGPTGADCCASNLFLDSYGDYRNSLGRTTITMNFTLIEADDGSLLSDRLTMIPPLTREEFLRCLEIFLTKELNFAVMADFDSHVMTMVLPFMKVRFSENLLREFDLNLQPAAKTDAVASAAKAVHCKKNERMAFEEILGVMKKIWMDVLGYTELEDEANFFDIGGDSISAVK
ncbi:MAG: KR domain-containing protein, partial [Parachlamydiaceae bacterium]|nr:KR domain-containing protein [Parachlamydiaceae bacterium]